MSYNPYINGGFDSDSDNSSNNDVGDSEDELVHPDDVKQPCGLSNREMRALETERLTFGETEEQMAHRMFKSMLVPAVQSIAKIALHSSNEKLRLQASTYIVDRGIGRIQDNPPTPAEDPINTLLAEVVRDVYEKHEIVQLGPPTSTTSNTTSDNNTYNEEGK